MAEAAVTVDDARRPDAAGLPGRWRRSSRWRCARQLPLSVHAADLEGDARDEVVVRCWKSPHVLRALRGPPARARPLRERGAPPLEAALGTPALFDMNGDRRGDVVLCEHYTSGRGGGRGGVTRFCPTSATGRWGALTRSTGPTAARPAVGDVTGDGRP